MTTIERSRSQRVSHDLPEAPVATTQEPKVPTGMPTPSAGKSVLVNSHDSVKRTLERDPSQADRLIGERLRGSSSTDREIVMRAVAQRGNTGLRKYADAEQVLRSLRPFDKDQRADILASMKVGTRFSDAVKDEQATLKVPVQYESNSGASSVAELQKSALARSRADAAKVSDLSRNVMALNRAIGKVAPTAELVAGVGSAVGLVGGAVVATGESALRGSTAPLQKVGHRADTAGALMAGELTSKIASANATTHRFVKATGTYTDARNRYERAVTGNDFQAMARYSKEMAAASKEMSRLASSLAGQAKSIVTLQKGMDHAVIETAITVVLAGVSLSGAGHAVHGAKGVAKDIVKDGLMERTAGEIANRAGGH